MSIVNVFDSISVSCIIPVENETRTHSLTSHRTLESGASTVANYSFVVPLKLTYFACVFSNFRFRVGYDTFSCLLRLNFVYETNGTLKLPYY